MKEKVFEHAVEFSKESHGSSDYDKDTVFIMGASHGEFVPLSYLKKSMEGINDADDLKADGFIYSSLTFLEEDSFREWFEKQFSKKLTTKVARNIAILHLPDHKSIFDAVEGINKHYETLRDSMILINGKNLPVQLGEWYAKVIFGLKQIKSSSQRGFDFHLGDKKVEVKIHWADQSSPKGVKLKKSLVSMSDWSIVIYLSRNFMLRDICFLDSDFIERKFTGKGHTVFLKDPEVSQYFFSKSAKHFDKVINKMALMKFATPNFAMKLDGRL